MNNTNKELKGVLGIIEKEGKYLFGLESKAGPMNNQWRLLGGKLEEGENSKDALTRELREEAGLEIAIDGYLGTVEGTHVGILLDVYHGRWISGEIKPKLDENSIIGWHSFSDTFEMNVDELSIDLLCKYRDKIRKQDEPKRTYFGSYLGCSSGAIQ